MHVAHYIKEVAFGFSATSAAAEIDLDHATLCVLTRLIPHRADLTKEQRDEHIRRYRDLLGQRREVSTQIASKPQGGRPEGIASQIAAETGISKDTVRRALNPDRARQEREKNADRQAY